MYILYETEGGGQYSLIVSHSVALQNKLLEIQSIYIYTYFIIASGHRVWNHHNSMFKIEASQQTMSS